MNYDAFVGKRYEGYSMAVDADRLADFAKAVGASGNNSTAPPTFAFTVLMEAGQLFNVLDDMGIDKTRTVHGGQRFDYHRPIRAGDTVTGEQVVTEISEKKGGALVLIEVENRLRNQDGEAVADLHSTIIVRNG